MIQTRLLPKRAPSSGDSSVRNASPGNAVRKRLRISASAAVSAGVTGEVSGLFVDHDLGIAVEAQDDPTRIAGGLAGDLVLPIEVAHRR